MVHPHAGIVDRPMHDAVRIGLRRPDIVVDGACDRLAGGVELEDGDDFARLRLLDQIVVVEAPGGRDVGAEAAPGMAGVTARARADVEDADFQHIAGLGILDRDRAGQQMDADPLAGAALERAFDRPGAAPHHRLLLARPVKDALGAGVAGDHALVIVAGMVGQRLDRGAIPGTYRQGRRDHLAEISPVNGRGRDGEGMMPHGEPRESFGFELGASSPDGARAGAPACGRRPSPGGSARSADVGAASGSRAPDPPRRWRRR